MRKEFLFHKGDTSGELLRTVKAFINRYPNGVVVTVEPYCMGRSKEQNALYQLLIRRLSESTPYTVDEMKAIVKDKAVGNGYPVERDDDGDPIERNGSYVPLSTKKATVGQMEMLIECCYKLGAKWNIVLDDVKG